MKKLATVAAVLVLLLVSPTSPCRAESTQDPQPLMIAADILLLRPFSLGVAAIGFAVYVVSYPYLAFTDDGTQWENLVARPGRAVFTRCIGCDLIEEKESERSP